MAGSQSGPQREAHHRFTNQPATPDAQPRIARERSIRRTVGGAPGADDTRTRAGDLLEVDPGATVATAAVHTSAPPNPARPQTVWPESASDNRAPGFTDRPAPAGAAHAARERQTSIPAYHPGSDELPGHSFVEDDDDLAEDLEDVLEDDFADEIPDETGAEDEWLVAEQPTANLRQEALSAGRNAVDTSVASFAHESARDAISGGYLQGRVPAPSQPERPDVLGGPRYASPDGDLMPMTPLTGIPRSALANPRMERFQELREQRKAHERGERGPQDQPQVNERVRTWWMDLTPGLQRALKLQHEARESGTHAVPGYVVTVASAVLRMTDAFGKLAVSTRELANRAHATAGPTLKRMHDSAEAYAQALIDKLEGSPVQQQAAFLGPGRLAVLFRSGVTVGQAQRLLQSNRARPLRLIPRKHGFLALVTRGTEAEVAERLKQHPYVRDVIYMEYDDPSQSLSTEVPAIMGMRRA